MYYTIITTVFEIIRYAVFFGNLHILRCKLKNGLGEYISTPPLKNGVRGGYPHSNFFIFIFLIRQKVVTLRLNMV